jgi:hypothetical protein
MAFAVMVRPTLDRFEAILVGAPGVTATAPTREEALTKLETAISERLERGELVMLEISPRGLASLFGKYRDDPTLQEICDEAYRKRDADNP